MKKLRRKRGKSAKKMTKGELAWLWTKRVTLGSALVLGIREVYLGLGPRREHRRAVFEQALKAARELGLKLIVLGDPDGGVLNRALGRQWQCEGPDVQVVCIDPAGCGICGSQVQGWPENELRRFADKSAIIYDPGAFTRAQNPGVLAAEMVRVGVHTFVAEAEPTSLTAYFGFGRKRRVLREPQANGGVMTYKPLLLHPENGSRAEMQSAVGHLGAGTYAMRPPIPAQSVISGRYSR